MGGSVAAAMGRGNGNNAAGFTGVSDAPEWVQQLAQLALYFLLWTEAANARHTPELLWLLYHMMMSSSNFNKVSCELNTQHKSSPRHIVRHPTVFMMVCICLLLGGASSNVYVFIMLLFEALVKHVAECMDD